MRPPSRTGLRSLTLNLPLLAVLLICRAEETKKEGVLAAKDFFKYDPAQHAAAVAEPATPTTPRGEPEVFMDPVYAYGKRLPLTEQSVLTPEGKVHLAKQRYLDPVYQKTIGPLSAILGLLANPLGGWSPNAPEAMALYEQDELLRRKQELKDLSALDRFARDKPSKPQLKTPKSDTKSPSPSPSP